MFCDVDVDALGRGERRRHYWVTHRVDVVFMIFAVVTAVVVCTGAVIGALFGGGSQPFMQP